MFDERLSRIEVGPPPGSDPVVDRIHERARDAYVDKFHDRRRVALLQRLLLERLAQDRRVVEWLDQYAIDTGLAARADTIRESHADTDEALRELSRLVEQLDPTGHTPLDPQSFVCETLRVSCPDWLALQLIRLLIGRLAARATGDSALQRFGLGPALGPAAPWVSLVFHTGPYETVDQALTRLDAHARALRERLIARYVTQPAEDTSRPPKTGVDRYERWADWFYRHRVKAPRDSVHTLATAYNNERAASDRNAPDSTKTIRDAITRVEFLLDVRPVS